MSTTTSNESNHVGLALSRRLDFISEGSSSSSAGTSEVPNEFLEKFEEEPTTISNKPSAKETVASQMLKYMLEHNIMNQSQWYEDAHVEALTKFVTNNYFNANVSRFCDVVCSRMVARPFMGGKDAIFKPLSDMELEYAIAEHGEKIEYLMDTVWGFNPETKRTCVRAFVGVADRRFGKKNTVYFYGRSNTGKSILMDSFMEFFQPCVGYPSQNQRSGFPWGDAANRRVIRADEPHADLDNIDIFKTIMSGNVCNVDKKYAASIIINPTPVYMSSNKPLWELCLKEKESIINRCAFIKYLSTPCPEDFGTITKMDWNIILSKYYTKWYLYDVKPMNPASYQAWQAKKARGSNAYNPIVDDDLN